MKTDPPAQKAFATLRFEGDALDPAALTDLLAVPPTLAYRKGERFTLGKRGLEKVGQTGYWFLNTKDRLGPLDLNAHVRLIETMLTDRSARRDGHDRFQRLRSLVDADGLSVLTTLFWFGAAGEPAPTIDPRLRNLIGDLRGEIETDFMVQSRNPKSTAGRAA